MNDETGIFSKMLKEKWLRNFKDDIYESKEKKIKDVRNIPFISKK
jgi:hypothetical protein